MTEETATPVVRERAPEVAASGRGMRARLARIGTKSQPGNPVLEPLFNAVRANHPKADLALLERAYLTAEEMHGTQMRKSGDRYITHPLAVTTILADIGMTEPTPGRGAAPRHGRGHAVHPRAADRRLRRGGRAPSSTA